MHATTGSVEKVLLLFGPQIPRLVPARLTDLRKTILEDPKLQFLVRVVKDLPALWDTTILPGCPHLSRLADAKRQLQQLAAFLESEDVDLPPARPPYNLLLVPLTVVAQIAEYISLGRKGPVQGFCVGFLAAAAVASARNKTELEKWTATAVRLAVCIGAIVDLDENERSNGDSESSGCSSTWSVSWTSNQEKEYLDETLASFPQAYISCVTDVDRVTLTIPENQFADFSQKLGDGGLSAQAIGLRGKYHTASPERQEILQQLRSLCQQHEDFRFPDVEQLALPLRSTSDTKVVTEGALHEIALDCILVELCLWYDTVKAAVDAEEGQPVKLLSVGNSSGAIPRSFKLATTAHESLTLNEYASSSQTTTPPVNGKMHLTVNGALTSVIPTPATMLSPRSTEAAPPIAVIGMACRYAQADSLDEFWSLINSGKNAVTPVPADRFVSEELWRTPKGPFYGNFVKDNDAFDHRFFGMSAREATSMDPQQRLLLQVSYEAMESAGYADGSESPNRPVGCYVGAGYVEYEDNVASENATAFSASGTIRAFVSGKVSHYFGWTGPSVVFDTACSSSAVAIHHACKALQTNDCSVALAGGVNMITSPTFYQNLAAASFLSPTGASKAFDAGANGYCRGEGAGMLVLKPLAQAIADNDRILGTIVGSAVNQNSSCTPITVPDSNSQSDLYLQALSRAGVSPSEVSYVEAHGTGTQVGDPIECASIRTAFGGPNRTQELVIGSVKDVVGHTEGASGVTGVIKTLLMMQHGTIPKQPNFTRLNPKIPALEPDRLAIASQTRQWRDISRRTALVNNYGAAGSNAAIVVQEYQRSSLAQAANAASPENIVDYPIFISAKTTESLRAYSAALRAYLDRYPSITLGDIAYNLARKQNKTLEYAATWTTGSIASLRQDLEAIESGTRSAVQRNADKKKKTGAVPWPSPVVLCFGGQTGRSISLSRDLVESSALLRAHLDRCDEACLSLGLPSLFPRIFDPAPVEDLVALHAMLFSVQYASARAWLGAGVQVASLVGHSFGQLTALCVAGSMSLVDGLRLVTGRARLMEKLWGPDPGVMLAIEGDKERLDSVLRSAAETGSIDVACYNGPRNIVLAGEVAAIDAIENTCKATPGLKIVRLANSHAYHSRLADPVLGGLRALADSITYQAPSIPVETCSPVQNWNSVDATKIVQHTRDTVYFGDAVQRIAIRHPSCVWLEAGSATPIIGMVRRALPTGRGSDTDMLISVDLGRGNPWSSLAKVSSSLWAAGSAADFWAFHGAQGDRYRWLDLPPYQFAKTKHWIKYHPTRTQETIKAPPPSSGPPELVRRLGDANGECLFIVDPSHEFFDLSVSGHAVVGQSLCPAGLYFEMAIRAAKSLQTGGSDSDSKVPHIEQLHIQSPLGKKLNGSLFISLKRDGNSGGDNSKWSFSFFSCSNITGTSPAPPSQRTAHASGTVALLEARAVTSRLQFVGRLLGSSRYDQVASSPDANRLSGDVLYKVFGRVVNYALCYKGVRNTIAYNGEVVGDIFMPQDKAAERLSSGISDPLAIDNFLQVAGIHVNCLQAEGGDDDVSVCNAIGEVLWSEAFLQSNKSTSSEPAAKRAWRVYSNMEPKGKNTVVNDVFVLDPNTGAVILAILGAEFSQVSLTSLRRVLSKINGSTTTTTSSKTSTVPVADNIYTDTVKAQQPQTLTNGTMQQNGHTAIEQPPITNGDTASAPSAAASNVDKSVREMLSEVFGMAVEEVQPDSSLADLGVDSLMITEISSEIQKRFDVTLSMDDLQDLVTVEDMTKRLGGSSAAAPVAAAPQTNGVNGVPTTNGASYTNGVSHTNGVANTNGTSNGHIEEIEEGDGEGGVAAVGSDWLATSRMPFDAMVEESGFADFRKAVYPSQAQLVVAYTVEAFADLGCDLRMLGAGERLPTVEYLPKHEKLMAQMYRILEDAGLALRQGSVITRTDKPVPQTASRELHDVIVQKFPQYAGEHELLRTTGSRLADCLVGRVEPLTLMFGDAKARKRMEDVYSNGPMFRAATKFLAQFLVDVCERFRGKREIRILELGAGTGGTTSFLVKQIEKSAAGQKVRYTFSDISGSLVAAAKRKFSSYPFVDYAVLNVEKDPATQYRGQYDVIISTNCIHATPSLVRSTTNIRHMLREDGMLCLVEHTQNLYWFDLVWGLVDGWWLFDDGRTHALASELRWKKDLHTAGFRWVDWSDGTTEESKILRVIVSSPSPQVSSPIIRAPNQELEPASAPETQETVGFKQIGSLQLNADIYYPSTLQTGSEARAVALMIHGGGHVMLSRKDVRPKQTQLLLDAGFIPVSVDYRLCPETTLLEGPIADVRDALGWARNTLPFLARKRPDIRINGDNVVAVGWSTGGTLALSLGWTAPSAGLQPPQAILAFYCPTDYEDECWSRENKPYGDATMGEEAYDLWEGVASSPITAYNPPATARAAGGWMTKNDPRSRIVLHMNWHGQTVPVLVHGLKNKAQNGVQNATLRLPAPAPEQVQAISPLAQIRQGTYRTPTFLVHPYGDDLIPWQQAQRTADELARQGVQTELRLIDNAVHLFDLYPRYDGNVDASRAIADGYAFLSRYAA